MSSGKISLKTSDLKISIGSILLLYIAVCIAFLVNEWLSSGKYHDNIALIIWILWSILALAAFVLLGLYFFNGSI
jgi:hypothetical protein